MSVGIAMGLTQTLYPRNGSVGPHDAERAVESVHVRLQDLVPELEHLPTVLLVHTAQPAFKRRLLSRRDTVYFAETIIPVDATGADIPHPGPRS